MKEDHPDEQYFFISMYQSQRSDKCLDCLDKAIH